MSLTTLDEDLAVHQKLDDEPNDVGGLSAQELKERFDHAGLAIQTYLNEVHLPEVAQEMEATLEAAKEYADKKVVAMGAGDMAKAMYDSHRHETDIFDYAEEKAREVLGGAERFGYVAAGKCAGKMTGNGSARVELVDMVDPRGLWDETEKCFTVPAGAQGMLVTAQVKWARTAFGKCSILAAVNGIEAIRREGPDNSSGDYVRETVLLPLKVVGGDKVTVAVHCSLNGSAQAEVNAMYLRAEIIL